MPGEQRNFAVTERLTAARLWQQGEAQIDLPTNIVADKYHLILYAKIG